MLAYLRAIAVVVIYFCAVYQITLSVGDILEAAHAFIKRRLFKRPSYYSLIVIKK